MADDDKKATWSRLTKPRRSPNAPAPQWRQRAHELLQKAVDAEDIPQALVGRWQADVPRSPLRAAGGYSTVTTIDLDENSSLEVTANWTATHLDLTWASQGVEVSSFLVIAFRGPNGRLLARPEVVGRLDLQTWSASADDLGFRLDQPWELVVVVICDA